MSRQGKDCAGVKIHPGVDLVGVAARTLGEREYVFDTKLFAVIRVRAACEQEARELLARHLDCADANFGQWDDGSPIMAEASMDGEPDLVEVNDIVMQGTSEDPRQ